MNYRYVARVIGILLVFETLMLMPAMVFSLIDRSPDLMPILAAMGTSLLFGLGLSLIRPREKQIGVREGLLIVAGGWIAACSVGALPFLWSGAVPSFIDAFFETVSGFTTTGATVISNIEALPRGILFWRSFTHWLGGMGILVLTLAVMPALGVGSIQMFKAETPGPVADKIAPKMKDTAVILYTAYLGITVVETILLMLGGVSLFDSLVHTFGTVGTGGFSNKNLSVGGLGGGAYVQWVIAVFMMLSGVNFSLYYDIYKGKVAKVVKNEELRLYILIMLLATTFIAGNLIITNHFNAAEAVRHSFFNASSIMTTTGYTTVDYDIWPASSRLVLILLMFIGASAGSTGGAMKVVRILVIGKLIKREFFKLLHPRAVIPVTMNEKALRPDIVTEIMSFSFLYIFLFLTGSLFLTLEGIDLVSATSAVAATLGNVGPGLGLLGPKGNYGFFSPASKAMLSLMMLAGRLEIFTLFAILSPSFWRKGRKEPAFYKAAQDRDL